MPNGLKNWTFKNVVDFLKQHFFIFDERTNGSHHFYKGKVNGEVKIVEVQFHGTKDISPKCLQHDIIPKTGIPQKFWIDWASAGNKKAQKKVQCKYAEKL